MANHSRVPEYLVTGCDRPGHAELRGLVAQAGERFGMAATGQELGAGGIIHGHYQVEKELGRGTMGVVYLGRDLDTGGMVAIKTMALSNESASSELSEVKERFLREVETARRLNHPGIVAVFESGAQDGMAYLVMEFVPGRDLAIHARRESLLPLSRLLGIGARVAEALAYAHRQNVVHGDIKPANIMWEPEHDRVKVTDFGIARISDVGKTHTGRVLGTPAYMSPEQLSDIEVEGPSDLYSLGVTLYQLASGHLPFEGDSMARLMYKVANEPPANLLRLRPGLPPCVVQVIYRAMMKKPEQRYRDGDEMALSLRGCADRIRGEAG